MTDLVTYRMEDGIAFVTLDDGRLNVMTLAMLRAIDAALDHAVADQAVVVLSGRDDIFSAGFDIKVLGAGEPEPAHAMVRAGAELALRLLSHPAPVVATCAGHAYPMGAFLLLASDVRVGAEGNYRIGLNEVAIGIPVPSFGIELARQRLQPSYLNRTTLTGEMFGPTEAARAGFLDRVVPAADLHRTATDVATRLRDVHRASHATVKDRLRGRAIDTIRQAIDAEVTLPAYRAAGRARARMPRAG